MVDEVLFLKTFRLVSVKTFSVRIRVEIRITL